MKEIRCSNCNKLLLKTSDDYKGKIEAKCTRCKKVTVIKEGH